MKNGGGTTYISRKHKDCISWKITAVEGQKYYWQLYITKTEEAFEKLSALVPSRVDLVDGEILAGFCQRANLKSDPFALGFIVIRERFVTIPMLVHEFTHAALATIGKLKKTKTIQCVQGSKDARGRLTYQEQLAQSVEHMTREVMTKWIKIVKTPMQF